MGKGQHDFFEKFQTRALNTFFFRINEILTKHIEQLKEENVPHCARVYLMLLTEEMGVKLPVYGVECKQ